MVKIIYERNGCSETVNVESSEMGTNRILIRELLGKTGALPVPPSAHNAEISMSVKKLQEFGKYCKGGKKIAAIKLVREITGLGLREAKDLVDPAFNNHPY